MLHVLFFKDHREALKYVTFVTCFSACWWSL